MVDKRFIVVFLLMFVFTGISSYLVWKLIVLERRIDNQEDLDRAYAYEEIDFSLPVEAFLKRCAASSELSYVRRLFVNQWISSNQKDLASLIMYGQGATTYEDLKKALLNGVSKETSKSAAGLFITSSFKTIDEDPDLIKHVTQSLKEGYSSEILSLRGQMMQVDLNSKEYKEFKNEYKKQLDKWIDKKHGKLLDQIIAKM